MQEVEEISNFDETAIELGSSGTIGPGSGVDI
jgi:hypothetical protein